MDWDDLRVFLALVRHRSVRAAGTHLRVSHSTVIRRIDALEARVGTRLFDRHRDGYAPTAAGLRMLDAAERVESEVHALTREVAGQDRTLNGRVHLTCGEEYVAAQLLADLAPWCRAHPGVELVVTTDGRPFNLARGEADLAIRALGVGADPPDTLVAHRLAPIVLATYVAAHAPHLDPPGPEARWLGFEDPRLAAPIISTSSFATLPVWGAFTSLPVYVAAVAEGLGLGALPTYVGDPDPRLRRHSHPDLRHLGELWLLFHPDLRDTARLRAAREVIRQGFARRAGLYAGWSKDGPLATAPAPARFGDTA